MAKPRKTDFNENGMTEREQTFADALLSDPSYNLGNAALKAGCPEGSHNQQGYEMHIRPRVRKYIDARKRERMAALKIDADYVLYELVGMREMRVSEIFYDDFSLKPLNEWPDVWLKNVSALDVTELNSTGDVETFIKKLKIPDKHKVLVDIGKHTKINAFTDIDIKGSKKINLKNVGTDLEKAALLIEAAANGDITLDSMQKIISAIKTKSDINKVDELERLVRELADMAGIK